MLKREYFTKKRNWFIANLIDFLGLCILKISRKKKNSVSREINKILILRNDGIGDVIITFPLIKSLRTFFTKAEIDILIRPKAREILKKCFYIDKIIVSSSKMSDLKNAFNLRSKNYDVVINPRPDSYLFNHLLSFIINSKRRIGFAMKGGGFFLTDIIPWEKKNIVQLLLNILPLLGKPRKEIKLSEIDISIDSEDEAYVDKLLEKEKISNYRFLVGINPFAHHPFIWPLKNYKKVVKVLVEKYEAKVIFIGEDKVKDEIDKLQKLISFPTVSLAGKTTLSQLIALIKRLNLLITVDSSPRHIANMVGTPVITLRNGANSNILWGSYDQNDILLYHDVSCSPCGKSFCPLKEMICMTSITPEEVILCIEKIVKKINYAAGIRVKGE